MRDAALYAPGGEAGVGPEATALSPPFPIPATKFAAPFARPGSVARTALVERLTARRRASVVTVVAPAGYGKTTLLSQWASHGPRPFTWLTVDARDNDPRVFLTSLAVALDRVVDVDPVAFRGLPTSRQPPVAALARLLPPPGSVRDPAVVVIDDAHLLDDVECGDVLTALIEWLPEGWRLALGSRVEPQIGVARLRAEGRIEEIGVADLAMDDEEAGVLLRSAGIEVRADQVAGLNRTAEGWAAVLYLEALAIRSGTELRPLQHYVGDRFVLDYLHSEALAGLPAPTRAFLVRTSFLERLSAPLCDAVLDRSDCTDTLAWLERHNLLVVPLDRNRHWYRYHHLFRGLLLAELERRPSGEVAELRRRAADWYESHGFPELAIDQAMEAGDTTSVARLLTRHAMTFGREGRSRTVLHWLDWFDTHGLMAQHAQVAIAGTWLHILDGRPATALRWADAATQAVTADRAGPDADETRGQLALLRAAMCPAGLDRARADAERAARLLSRTSPWLAANTLVLGILSRLMVGSGPARTVLQEALEVAEDTGASVAASVALAELALVRLDDGEVARALELVDRAAEIVTRAGLGGYATTTLVEAVTARVHLRGGDPAVARASLARAQRLRPSLTHTLPFVAVQARLELGRCYLALLDAAGARTVLREADDILVRHPQLHELARDIAQLRERVGTLHAEVIGASSLTAAELRLLPLLPTHLSFREIGQRLFISQNTVKTEAISVYRKLGVSSRGEAIARARELGLLAA